MLDCCGCWDKSLKKLSSGDSGSLEGMLVLVVDVGCALGRRNRTCTYVGTVQGQLVGPQLGQVFEVNCSSLGWGSDYWYSSSGSGIRYRRRGPGILDMGHGQIGINYSGRGAQSCHMNESDRDGEVGASRRCRLHG